MGNEPAKPGITTMPTTPDSSPPTPLGEVRQEQPPVASQAGSLLEGKAAPDAQRTRGYRNTMAAGALTLSLVCGLLLLMFVLRDIVPRAQQKLRPTPEPVLYTATLWCLPCQQASSPIVLWEKVGDGISRGGKTGELVHNTEVAVIAQEWSAPEGRTYYLVTADGQRGWVPETFVKR